MDLIRIGKGSFKPVRNIGRWNEPQPGWSVNAYYGYVEVNRWNQIQDFQTLPHFNIDPVYLNFITTTHPKDDIINNSIKDDILKSPLGLELLRKMNLPKSKFGPTTVWEMDALISGPPDWDYIRFTAFLGQPNIRPWSWVDTYIKLPIALAYAKLLSILIPNY